MSLITGDHWLSVKPFAAVPALLHLPEIQRGPLSVSHVSSRSRRADVDLEEGCLVTKSVKYTHQLAHFVNAVRFGDPEPVEDLIVVDLKIIPSGAFTINDPCNLAFLESFVHTSLDLYAFIAITPSSSTVGGLIDIVGSDNDRRQQEMDQRGRARARSLNFLDPSFADPEYELVVLHPEHFLPDGCVLPIHDRATKTSKNYVVSSDRCLRESTEPGSPRLLPFRHTTQDRDQRDDNINVFLVAINAEIKFRRYFRMIGQQPPTTQLPDDVLALMHRVVELVQLLYWAPVPSKGSRGEAKMAEMMAWKRKNVERAGRSSRARYVEKSPADESETGSLPSSPKAWKMAKRRRQLEGFDLEARRAYGTALMSGHDVDYDPTLFENAFPVDETHCFFSDKMNVEAWKQATVSGSPGRTSSA